MTAGTRIVPLGELGSVQIAWTGERLDRVELLGRSAPRDPTVTASPDVVRDLVERLGAYAAGDDPRFEEVPLPFDRLRPFQARVLLALRRVAHGETSTYGELAAAAGSPQGSRAVGLALGTNPWAIVVPCHRVLRADGSLGGFSGGEGPTTKRALLAHERAHFRACTPR